MIDNELENKLDKIYRNIILYDEHKQVKILKNQQMCVWETIWKIIERNRTKENKCIIKGMIRWKIP